MFSLVLAESSLELVPKSIQNHQAIISHTKKLNKQPAEILLDNSWHFAAMKGIELEHKRGRPDIVHLCLLQACTIPLYFEKKMNVYIHTIDNKVITIGKNVRIPKSYHRFEGLIEKLYKEKTIENNENVLLELHEMSFSELLDNIKPKKVIGFSTAGINSSYEKVAAKIDDGCIVIGGFQKGHFSDQTKNKIDVMYCIEKQPLEAHVVIGRILYEYEKTIFM